MKNIPTKLFLVIGEDVENEADFNDLDHEYVCWCQDRINKNDIDKPVILSCLRVWIKQTNKPDYSNIKSDKATLLRTAEKRGEERDFHKFRLKKCLSESELNEHYKNMDEYLKSQGY